MIFEDINYHGVNLLSKNNYGNKPAYSFSRTTLQAVGILTAIITLPVVFMAARTTENAEVIKEPSSIAGEFAYWSAGENHHGRLLQFHEDRSVPVEVIMAEVSKVGLTITEAEIPGCGTIRFTADDLGSIYGAATQLDPEANPNCPVTSWEGTWRIGEIH